MNKVVMICLLVISSQSFAGWSFFGFVENSPNGSFNLYIDFDNIREKDGYLYHWELTDYLKIVERKDLDAFRSFVALHQVDCKLFRSKILSIILYEGNMGKGKELFRHSYNNDWDYAAPSDIGFLTIKEVCK